MDATIVGPLERQDCAFVTTFLPVDDGLNPRLFAFLGARDLGGGVVDGFMFPMN